MFLVMMFVRFFGGDVSSFIGRDFSSDVFFVLMFLQIFLVGKYLLRDCLVDISLWIFWQRMYLQSFLGRILR